MLEQKVLNIDTFEDFRKTALEVFRFQYENVSVYRRFCDFLNTDVSEVKAVKDIPFLPIALFKSHKIIAENLEAETIFTSSGTTGSEVSKHHVAKLDLYEKSFLKAFKNQYGDPSNYTILALLPSYLEREGSSLIYMVDCLIKKSNTPNSGFYLYEMDKLIEKLEQLEATR